MTPPKVVSFDCAQTLLEVDWSIKRYVADVCAIAKLQIPLEGPSLYEQMYHDRLASYVQVNMSRDHQRAEDWWIQLGGDWLQAMGLDANHAPGLQKISNEIGFGPKSVLFRAYDDVEPVISRLKTQGMKLAVLSNWDYSLHKALRGFGLYDCFDLVVASLEYGVEKPDPRLFQVVTDHFAVEPNDVLHIGDHLEDDFEGAKRFGMRAALIDRSRAETSEPWLSDLRHIEEAYAWTS
jgi:REG-2-like HAD superfamily hydrolase